MNSLKGFHFIFAGKNSEDMGVKIISSPIRQLPVMNGEKVSLPGKSGFLFVADGGYGSVTCKIDIAIPDNEDLPDVLNWLRGSGDLIFSDSPDYAYEAMVLTAANRTSMHKHLDGQKMTLTFTCQPFRHSIREKDIILTHGSVFNGKGHVNTSPLIAVEGTGVQTLTVNGRSMYLTLTAGTPLYIDCEAGTAYTISNGKYTFAGECVTLLDDWFELLPQSNKSEMYNNINFTAGVSKVTITPRWRWF